MLENRVGELAAFLRRHPRLLVVTGAGISTASGIPDYRDRDGVRRGNAPVQGPEFRKSEAVRKRYWARSMAGWPVLSGARPNTGHRALAQLEADGRLAALVTQNVDGLHQRAGSRQVVELHGSIHAVVCLGCGTRSSRAQVQSLLEQQNPGFAAVSALPAPDGDAHLEPARLSAFRVPQCPRCDGMLKPDVVFFGDGVAPDTADAAGRAVADADAVLVVGTSLMVFSAYRLCRLAAQNGKPLVAINAGVTRADALMSFKIEDRSEAALPLLRELLLQR